MLRKKVALYEMEQKESQIRIKELEQEVKELKLRLLDPSRFEEWDSECVLRWIMNLENGRFKTYEKVLRHSFEEEKVRGSHLGDVDATDVKGWGVKPFDDKKALTRYIQQLVQQYRVKEPAEPGKYNEGIATGLF